MPLTNADAHHWAPIPEVVNWLAEKYKGQRVLEIGPGYAKFPAATHFIDWRELPDIPPEQMTKLDVGRDRLPLSEPRLPGGASMCELCDQWDFIYCRHVLEDMHTPFHLIAEMSRVGKAGYIETPSPICELTRGVDGNSPPYRGYNHHRWIVWSHDGELRFVAKYPYVEYLGFPNEAVTEQMLRSSSRYWNTYHLWEGEIRVTHQQSPHDFLMPDGYGVVLSTAMMQSKESTDSFCRTTLNVP